MNEKIAVVVVTYNRLALLKECIKGIQKQTQPFEKLIIVNNGSTDGTSEYLQSIENHYIQIIHQENVGSAGGFHTAIKTAYEQGFDWIWMMDDDVEAKSNCLENLLKYKEVSKCLHPNKQYIGGEEFYWEHYYNPFNGTTINVDNISFKNGKDICFVNVGCFEGMLIHRSVVDKIGFPNPDYFIFGDDLEYGFLASLHTNVSYIKDACLIRKKRKEDEKPSLLTYYYGLRNRHLLKKVVKREFSHRKLSLGFSLGTLKVALLLVGYIVLKDRIDIWKKVKLVFRALIDNNRKIVGKVTL